MKKNVFILLITIFSSSMVAIAQDDKSKQDASSIVKELANPNATRGQLFNNFSFNF